MSRIFKPRFFKVEAGANDVKLFRDGGGDIVGNYSTNGKIWHSLGQLKNHYINCLHNYCYAQHLNYHELKPRITELLPNNTIIEYELKEIRRFPAKELFKK